MILLLTWTLAFIFANLSLLSVNQHEWFFHLETIGDKACAIKLYVLYVEVLELGILNNTQRICENEMITRVI